MSVTITQLAKELNISHSMVSRVLNGKIKGVVRQEIADRILALAHERGYVPNITARTLKTGKSGILGLVIGEISERFSGCYAQALLNEAERYGYRLILSTTNYGQDRERNSLGDLLRFHVDGVIYPLHLGAENPLYAELLARHFPLMTGPTTEGFSSVVYDYSGAFDGMFAEFRRRGHRKILFLSWPYDHYAATFEARAELAGLEVEKICFNADERYNDDVFAEIVRRGGRAVYTHSFSELRNLLRYCELTGAEKPDCSYTYTLPFEYLADSAVLGAVAAPLRERVEFEVSRLIQLVEENGQTPCNEILACRFLTHEMLKELWSEQCGNSWYKHYR